MSAKVYFLVFSLFKITDFLGQNSIWQ